MSRILLVHPEGRYLESTASALRRSGHEVIIAENGEKALDLFVRQSFDVLIVDVDLPGRDGVSTIESFRSAPKGRQALVILTGTRTSVSVVKRIAQELGANPVPDGSVAGLLKALTFRSIYPPPSVSSHAGIDPTKEPSSATMQLSESELLEATPPPRASRASQLDAQESDIDRRAHFLRQNRKLDGYLNKIPFGAVLAQLGELRATGALVLSSSGDPRETTTGESPQKIVFFRNGIPVLVHSNLVEECLGPLLLRHGAIDEEALEESRQRVRDGDGRQGGILIAIGAITPHQLRAALVEQQREKLFDIFAWPTGRYAFSETMNPPSETITLEMSLAEIIYQGIRDRIPSTRMLDILAPHLTDYAVRNDRNLRGLLRVVPTTEQEFLQTIDGKKTLDELITNHVYRVHAAQVLWTARCLGVIAFRDTPEQKEVVLQPNEDERAHLELARIVPLLRDGRYGEALGIGNSNSDSLHPNADDEITQQINSKEIRIAVRSRQQLCQELVESVSTDESIRSLASETLVRLSRAEAILLEHRDVPDVANLISNASQIEPARESSSARGPSTRELPIENTPPRRIIDVYENIHQSKQNESVADSLADAMLDTEPDLSVEDLLFDTFEERKALSVSDFKEREDKTDPLSSISVELGGSSVEMPIDLNERVERMLQAERYFQRGRRAFLGRDLDKALIAFTHAVDLVPDEGEFVAHQAWVRFALAEGNASQRQALADLKRSCVLAPKLDRAHLFYARALRLLGNITDARNAFAKALAANPECTEALEELRALDI